MSSFIDSYTADTYSFLVLQSKNSLHFIQEFMLFFSWHSWSFFRLSIWFCCLLIFLSIFLFLLYALLVVFVLLLVKRKSLDNVGMSFLLVTSIKMVFCYLILRPILKVATLQNSAEKINFFALFILFLLIETLFTIRLVNEKQK